QQGNGGHASCDRFDLRASQSAPLGWLEGAGPLELALCNSITNCRSCYCNVPLRQALRHWLPDKAGPLSAQVFVASVFGVQLNIYWRFVLRTKCSYPSDNVSALGGCLRLRSAASRPNTPTHGNMGDRSSSAISFSCSDSQRWISLSFALRLGNDLCQTCVRFGFASCKSLNSARALDWPG